MSRNDTSSLNLDLEQLREAAGRFARAAGQLTLQYFNKSFDLSYKDDQTPVTNADRESEKLLRKKIEQVYPDHGIVGEEFEAVRSDSPVQWILDPIDGTRAFVHAVPLYTTLIGVFVDEQPKVGAIYAPATDELCTASAGGGAWYNGERASVREDRPLAEATLLTTDMTTPAERGYEEAFDELVSRTAMHRTWGNAYGHLMVATGRADIMFDPILNLWDAAPLLTILPEAGGRFSDVMGEKTGESEHGFISTVPGLYEEVMNLFNHT